MSVNPEAILPKRQLDLSADLGASDVTFSHYWVGPLVAALEFLGLVVLCPASATAYSWIAYENAAIRPGYVALGCLVAVLTVALLESRGLYRRSYVLSRSSVAQILKVWITVFSFLAVSAFLLSVGREFSRGSLLIYFVLGGTGLIGGRFIGRKLLGHAIAAGTLRGKRVFLIGDRDHTSLDDLTRSLQRHGYTVVSSFLFDPAQETHGHAAALSWPEVAELIRSKDADEVMLSVSWANHARIQRIIDALSVLPLAVHLLPDHRVAKLLDRPMTDIGLTKTVELKREPLRWQERATKRTLDCLLAAGALALLAPLMLTVAALIRLDSAGPVLFRQMRVGFSGRTFRIYKFRTMITLEDGPDIRQATRGDARVTRIGRWLRASSIDELPQLFNVLIGDMSLVGPRPHAVAHDDQYDLAIANYALRHHVKPGITGWAQVCGLRGETPTVDLMLKRVEHDLWYIDNWSFWLDSVILMRTIIALMRPQNSY